MTMRYVGPQFIGEATYRRGYKPRRKFWYRIEERFNERTPVDKSLVGMEVLAARVIVRVGYFWQYKDVDSWDIKATVRSIMLRDLQQILKKLSIKDMDEKRQNQMIDLIADKWGQGIEKRAVYIGRNLWLREMYGKEEYKAYKDKRTFWYIDLECVDPIAEQWFKVISVDRHVLGERYAASGGFYIGPDGDEYDYCPGGLAPMYFQSVYKTETRRTWAHNYDDHSDAEVKIHPRDILDARHSKND